MQNFLSFCNKQKVLTMTVLSFVILNPPSILADARDGVARDFPIYDNGGLPDLTVEPQRFESQMSIVDRYFEPGSCSIDENAVGGPGYRRLLRFDTVILNRGDGDVVIGNRSDPQNPYAKYFVYHSCHQHYHINGFSYYQLLSTGDNQEIVRSTKQGFCFEDSFKYGSEPSHGYHCENQGITSGWGDWYYKQLGGQWIDITGIPEGNYIVRVTINPPVDDLGNFVESGNPIFEEGENRYPNVIETRIHIPDPRNKVSVE